MGTNAGRSRSGRGVSPRGRVFVIDGKRTPFLKARGKPGPFTAVDLATAAGQALLLEYDQIKERIDEVILGCGAPGADAPNPARVCALRMGLPAQTPGFSVQRNCGSGMQSLDTAFKYIAHGYADCILAGGTESLSHAPLILREEAAAWLGEMQKAKTIQERFRVFEKFRPRMLQPEVGIEKGLTDSVVHLNMGQTAEVLRHEWDIRREDADAYALESHRRLASAQEEGRLNDEVVPVYTDDGEVHARDDGVRPDTSMEKLRELKPVFEPPYGDVTAGNSSQVTDGACWLLVASEAFVSERGLEPLGQIIDSEWAALDPRRMGLGPTLAVTPMMQRQGLSPGDIDVWELNEAFAHQVLACLKAWTDPDFCRDTLGLDGAFGEIDRETLNVDGGAISLGHPVGTSGARIALHALNALKRTGGKRAVATECIGGGQGGAVLLEAA